MRKITKAEIERFERDLLFKQIADPDYRYGQAFLNYFPWVEKSIDRDGGFDNRQANKIWNSKDRLEVLYLVDFYIEDTE